jgi:hypothetical protein
MPQRTGGKPATEPVSCCASAAAAKLEYLFVGGHRVAIARLSEILEKARSAEPDGEAAVRRELVCLARAGNYIPPSAEKDYEAALFAEYSARKGSMTGSAQNVR